jgi:hypothetical protein
MERYFNNYQTTVAPGGYTSGSGVLNVLSTSGIALNAGDTCRLSLYTGSPELVVILVASAVNSGSQFAVAAEGADVSAVAGDLVLNTLTVGGMNQIRTDISMMGPFANLPVPGSSYLVEGQRFKSTDGPYEFIFDGTSWIPFVGGWKAVLPIAGNYTWANQGGATVTDTAGFLQLSVPGSGSSSIRVQFLAQPSTPYTLDAMISIDGVFGESNQGGIGFYDGTKLSLLLVFGGNLGSGSTYQQTDFSSVTSSGTPNATAGQLPTPSGPLFLRITNDGSNLTFYIGNGYSWTQIRQVAVGSFLTPTDLCFIGNSQNASDTIVANLISWYTH